MQVQMETFAAKVRYGSGSRFDLTMEEKGGWIAGEAPKQDVEMSKAKIEVIAEASQQIMEGELNPFKEQARETLPTNLERNFSGFLVRKDPVKFKVDPQKLKARIALLKEELLIAKFLGPKPPPQDLERCLQSLNHEVGESHLSFCMNVGKGFFFLRGEDTDALHNALMLSPYKTKWGTCMIQSWVPGFNPDNPSNLAFPTWVALRRLPFEHHDQALAIVATLGEVIGIDTSNETAKDPRFCVNLDINKGWVTNIDLEVEGGILPPLKILVDYDKLPMRCKACHSWKHRVRDCNEIHKRPMQRGRRLAYVPHTYQQEKGKSKVVDEDGFQQVRHRKNTSRNIFDQVDVSLKENTYVQRETVGLTPGHDRQPQRRSNHAVEIQGDEGEGQDGENQTERHPTIFTSPRPGQEIPVEIHGTCIDNDSEPHVGNIKSKEWMTPEQSTGGTEETLDPESVPNQMGINTERRQEQWEEPVGSSVATNRGRDSAPEKGRREPASHMQWSPIKLAGQKRPLELTAEEEAAHEVDTEEEEGLGEEVAAKMNLQVVGEDGTEGETECRDGEDSDSEMIQNDEEQGPNHHAASKSD